MIGMVKVGCHVLGLGIGVLDPVVKARGQLILSG